MFFLTSERSEEVPFLRVVHMRCGARGPQHSQVFLDELHRSPPIKVKRFSDYTFANKFAALGLLIK